MVQAALGGDFEVPTIDGDKARVKIPEGTQSGRRMRLAGKGMPVLRSKHFGDMYVQVTVETPQNLTKKQRELLAEFNKISSEDTQPETEGFFSKVRDFIDGMGDSSRRSGS
jgi:molecular chaperone DnaJ